MTETYVNRLVLALRMLDVPGDRIGQVVAEVEAHVAESHEAPAEAFGSAEDYAGRVAAALDRPAARWRAPAIAWSVTLATMLLADGVLGLASGRPIELTAGKLLLFVLLPPAAVFLVRLIGSGRSGWPAGLGVVLLFAAVFGVPVLLPEPVLSTYPAWPALALGAVLAAGTLPWVLRPDHVIDPRDGRNRYPLPRRLVVLMAAAVAVPLLMLVLAAAFRPGAG